MQVRTDHTGQRTFMFTLAAVYAKDELAAQAFAEKHGLTGPAAREAHIELMADAHWATRRAAWVWPSQKNEQLEQIEDRAARLVRELGTAQEEARTIRDRAGVAAVRGLGCRQYVPGGQAEPEPLLTRLGLSPEDAIAARAAADAQAAHEDQTRTQWAVSPDEGEDK